MAKVTVPNLQVRAGRGSLHRGVGPFPRRRLPRAGWGWQQGEHRAQRQCRAWQSPSRVSGNCKLTARSFTHSPQKLSLLNTIRACTFQRNSLLRICGFCQSGEQEKDSWRQLQRWPPGLEGRWSLYGEGSLAPLPSLRLHIPVNSAKPSACKRKRRGSLSKGWFPGCVLFSLFMLELLAAPQR